MNERLTVEIVVWILGTSTHLAASEVPDLAVNAGSEKIDRDRIFMYNVCTLLHPHLEDKMIYKVKCLWRTSTWILLGWGVMNNLSLHGPCFSA